MANSIVTNSAAQAAIRSLFTIDRDTRTTQSRIESGLAVNKASDDPAVFSIAQGMRADMAGLKAVQDNQAFGLAAINVANNGAKSISDKLTSLKQTVTQAQQQGLDKATMNAQLQSTLDDIDTFATSATYNGINLLVNSTGGDRDETTLSFLQDISGRQLTVANAQATSKDLGLEGLQADNGGIRLDFSADATDFVDGDTISFQVGSGTATQTYVFEFNQDGTNTAVTAGGLSNAAGADVKVISVNLGTADDAFSSGKELGNLVDKMKEAGFGIRLNSDNTVDVFRADITQVGVGVAAFGGAATAQVALTKATSGTETFFLSQGSALTASNVTMDVATAGINTANSVGTDGAALVSVVNGRAEDGAGAVTTAGSATARFGNAASAIDTVNQAIEAMNTKISTLGAATKQVQGLQEFSKTLMDSLKDGLGALVDADLAEESARLQSLQSRQQLAIQSLSIANQQPQSLLGLFR